MRTTAGLSPATAITLPDSLAPCNFFRQGYYNPPQESFQNCTLPIHRKTKTYISGHYRRVPKTSTFSHSRFRCPDDGRLSLLRHPFSLLLSQLSRICNRFHSSVLELPEPGGGANGCLAGGAPTDLSPSVTLRVSTLVVYYSNGRSSRTNPETCMRHPPQPGSQNQPVHNRRDPSLFAYV